MAFAPRLSPFPPSEHLLNQDVDKTGHGQYHTFPSGFVRGLPSPESYCPPPPPKVHHRPTVNLDANATHTVTPSGATFTGHILNNNQPASTNDAMSHRSGHTCPAAPPVLDHCPAFAPSTHRNWKREVRIRLEPPRFCDVAVIGQNHRLPSAEIRIIRVGIRETIKFLPIATHFSVDVGHF